MSSDSRPLLKDGSKLEIEMVVIQSGNELEDKETTIGSGTYPRDLVYYLDGHGESNEGFTKGFVHESKKV